MEPEKVQRLKMVEEQMAARGVSDARVLDAFRGVPRHLFVPAEARSRAHEDHPIGIGFEQTISQPYMAACMTEALGLSGGEKVLEVGTGSGYQAAILAAMGAEVWTIERISELAEAARAAWRLAGVEGIRSRTGDGTLGWPEEAPFDRVLVTAGAPSLPITLLEQLREGGAMVIPVGGEAEQHLLCVRREGGLVKKSRICSCVFVKLVGKEGW